MSAITEVRPIAASHVKNHHSGSAEWLLLDVRTPGEFAEAHIPGSMNVPLPDVRARCDAIRREAGEKQIAIVCRTGRRAGAAYGDLAAAGLEKLWVLDGGIEAWRQEGLPVQCGAPAISLERQVRIAAGALVVLGTGLGAFVTPWLLALPAFVGGGLLFAGLTDTCGMAMLLARMPWNRTRAACAADAATATPDRRAA